MRDIIENRAGRWGRGHGRGGVGARRELPVFDHLESRRLLNGTPMPPTAQFPLSQFRGAPEGITQDANGNSWVLLEPNSIAKLSSGGNFVAEY